MVGFWVQLSVIIITLLASLIILLVQWDRLKGMRKISLILSIAALCLSIDTVFLRMETQQNIAQIEIQTEQIKREISLIDHSRQEQNMYSVHEELNKEDKQQIRDYFIEKGLNDQEVEIFVNQLSSDRGDTLPESRGHHDN